MIGSNVIAQFANAIADATTLEQATTIAKTFAKDIKRAGVGDACASILTQRRKELRS